MSYHNVEFHKYHGVGNDFIIIDEREGLPFVVSEFAKLACHRHFGIGADGVIALGVSNKADFLMSYYNADGSSGTCGNGMRCLARFIKDIGALPQHVLRFSIETLSRIVEVEIRQNGSLVKVDMGEPVFDSRKIPVKLESREDLPLLEYPVQVGRTELLVSSVGMGNPHAVVFVDDLSRAELMTQGAQLEYSSLFPERTNVEFVKVLSDERVEIRIWERGVGETLACGTGACAVLVIGHLLKRLKRKAVIKSRGGEVMVSWQENSNRLSLIGPARKVYTGVVDMAHLGDTETIPTSLCGLFEGEI